MRTALLLFCLLLVTVGALAQTATRPKATGNGTIDTYVTNSFDLHDKVEAQKSAFYNVEKLIQDGRAASGGTLTDAQVQEILPKLEEISNNVTDLQGDVQELASGFAGMQAEAKKLPPTKVPAALKAVDAANDINKKSAADLTTLATGVADQIKALKG